MIYRIDKWSYNKAKSLCFALFSIYIGFVQPLKSPKELLLIKLDEIRIKRISKISRDKLKAIGFKKKIIAHFLKLYKSGHRILVFNTDENKLYIDDAFSILYLDFGLPLNFNTSNNTYTIQSTDFIIWFNNLSNKQILELDLI